MTEDVLFAMIIIVVGRINILKRLHLSLLRSLRKKFKNVSYKVIVVTRLRIVYCISSSYYRLKLTMRPRLHGVFGCQLVRSPEITVQGVVPSLNRWPLTKAPQRLGAD